MTLHSTICCEYGQDRMKLVQDYDNLARKVASWKNHLCFNLHCKHHDASPMSLRLVSNVRAEKVDKILRQAERSWLGVRICQTVIRKLDILTLKWDKLKRDVWDRLPEQWVEIDAFVNTAKVQKHAEVKIHQQNKFKKVLDTKLKKTEIMNESKDTLEQDCILRWIKNCSDHILSDPELSVLKKALNFAVTPKRLPMVDVVTATESACRQLAGPRGRHQRTEG